MFSFLEHFWHGKARNELELKLSNVNLVVDDRMITDTKLPTLVAHGDESSGKSTLLAEMIQFDMFDIGKDMITRMVWVYRLRFNATQTVPRVTVRIPGKPIVETMDPAEVRALMQAVHMEIKNSGHAISEQEGYIEIYSNRVPRMDIIDLPGSIASPKEGEPASLVSTSRRIASKYLTMRNNIIMYVQSGTTLQRNSVAAGLLAELKTDNKIITVLTKVDCAIDMRTTEPLSQFMETFRGKDDDVIAVSNYRRRPDMTFAEVRDEEHKFFIENVSSEDFATYGHRLGVPALLHRINTIAESLNRVEWTNIRCKSEQEKLAILQSEYDSLGKKYSTAELCAIVADELITEDGMIDKTMRDVWAEMKIQLPTKADPWFAPTEIDGTTFASKMNTRILNQLDRVFECSMHKLQRFENFCVDYRHLLSTRLSNRMAAFVLQWNKVVDYLLLEHITGSPQYSVDRWFHSACSCYIQCVLMKLGEMDDRDDARRTSRIFMHFVSAPVNQTIDEREIGPPPQSLKSVLELIGAHLSCDESPRVIRCREDIQQQTDVVRSILDTLRTKR